jgi:hypothetical protein
MRHLVIVLLKQKTLWGKLKTKYQILVREELLKKNTCRLSVRGTILSLKLFIFSRYRRLFYNITLYSKIAHDQEVVGSNLEVKLEYKFNLSVCFFSTTCQIRLLRLIISPTKIMLKNKTNLVHQICYPVRQSNSFFCDVITDALQRKRVNFTKIYRATFTPIFLRKRRMNQNLRTKT